mmetsp:Transcript_41463/g.67283  ORF Transcript_41463/g.67283 Transcript_41463/m.67283 type:complete len:378 (+) Transcript_41463:180-1313(+)|eukprot:CAMPEP_0184655788 /NCGR_PEP_ID=MMETSP0308-20130426/14420_1 /TAXON_ID=38269 /ORGANISM="Gloeochaete witrockiana, Strain SAG 46.84" /LENGTH=377 /DNA_ID=CAMNT_0027092527 /DNA_START=176 /DNA_END=1309 /DNA_ORIENTATION=-
MGGVSSRRSGGRPEREGGRGSRGSNERGNHGPVAATGAQPANAASQNTSYPLPHQYYVMQNGLYTGQPLLVGGHRLIPANQLPSFFLEGIRPDLAFLPFQQQRPLPPPPQMQHTCTIRNDVNLKKNSLKLIKDDPSREIYRLEFVFDASVDCTITVFFVASEVSDSSSPATFRTLHENPQREPRPFPKGLGQVFTQPPDEGIDLSMYKEDEIVYGSGGNQFPIVIRLEGVNGPDTAASNDGKGGVKCQSTFASFAKLPEGGWTVKVIKQKILVGTTSYELQEIYGIEQNSAASGNNEEEAETGRECVICMSEPRDTTLLPCRHMCMCNECAKVLRYQTNKCPICRSPVESLLQIKVSSKKDNSMSAESSGSTAPADK